MPASGWQAARWALGCVVAVTLLALAFGQSDVAVAWSAMSAAALLPEAILTRCGLRLTALTVWFACGLVRLPVAFGVAMWLASREASAGREALVAGAPDAPLLAAMLFLASSLLAAWVLGVTYDPRLGLPSAGSMNQHTTA